MLLLAGLALASGLGAWALAYLRSRGHSPEEIERRRRLDVHRRGRITSGRVVELLDTEKGASGCLVVYRYEIGGVVYEVAQDVSALPELNSVAARLGDQIVSVKYDPRRPTNSIIACEEWSGIPRIGPSVH
jgi:hypothetical protein